MSFSSFSPKHFIFTCQVALLAILGSGCSKAQEASGVAAATVSISSGSLFESLQSAWKMHPEAEINLRALTFKQLADVMTHAATNADIAIDGVAVKTFGSSSQNAQRELLTHGANYANVGAFMDDIGVAFSKVTAADFANSVRYLPDAQAGRGIFSAMPGALGLADGDASAEAGEPAAGAASADEGEPAATRKVIPSRFSEYSCRILDGVTAAGLFGVGLGSLASYEVKALRTAANVVSIGSGFISGSSGLAAWWGCAHRH